MRLIKKPFIITLLFVLPLCGFCQTTVLSTGGEGTGTGGSMSFSIGQIEYVENADATGTSSQGVQHGEEYGIMWTGATSTDWSVGSNWIKGTVPTISDSAIITAYPSNQPHITTDVFSPTQIDDILIRSGASLTVNAGNALTVYEELANDGTVLVDADQTAIGSLITEGSISGSGSFKMKQYLEGTGGSSPNGLFFYTGSPVADATAATYGVTSGNKLWMADETTTSYPQITNSSSGLNPMQGYVARMGVNGTVTFDGSAFNTGPYSNTNLTRTGTTDVDRGYNLMANPYPSTVSWNNANRTNLSTTMWYRTHQGTTMLFDAYNATNGLGTNNNGNGAVTGDIPPTQAFWVRVPTDGLTGQLGFTDAMRSHAGWAGIYKVATSEGLIRITLSNGSVSDETIILFDSDAQNGFDDFDSPKFWASASIPQLYTTVGTDSLVINGLESIATNPVVDLGVKLPTQGNYSFDATEITLTEDVYLEDRLLNIFQDLNLDPTYDFTEAAGNHPTRFALHFGMSVTDIQNNDAFSAQVFSDGQEINILLSKQMNGATATVFDMAGRKITTRNINDTQTAFRLNSATGIYLVQLSSPKGTSTHKVLLK